MTEEQLNINKELEDIRDKFIKEHNISCSTCEYHTKTDRCRSRLRCIVREGVFFCPYKKE